MTLEEFRRKIEVDYKSYYGIGQVIHEMLQYNSHSPDEYHTMLEIVRDKLIGLKTDTERLQEMLDKCETMKDVGNFAQCINFGKYYERGIPVSKMITKRLNEISLENERKRSFFHKVLNIFNG